MLRFLIALVVSLAIACPLLVAAQAEPAAPADVSVIRAGCSTARIAWTQNSSANYVSVVRYSPTVAHGGVAVYDLESTTPLTPPLALSFTDFGAVSGEYYVLTEAVFLPDTTTTLQRYDLGATPGACAWLPFVAH